MIDLLIKQAIAPIRRQVVLDAFDDESSKFYAASPVVDDVKVSAKLTLGEDVADLGDTILAYVPGGRPLQDRRYLLSTTTH